MPFLAALALSTLLSHSWQLSLCLGASAALNYRLVELLPALTGAGCVALDVLRGHDDRHVLISLPLCFYLVLPKWLDDDARPQLLRSTTWATEPYAQPEEIAWHMEQSRLRRWLYGWLLRPKRPWNGTWPWKARCHLSLPCIKPYPSIQKPTPRCID